jgi:hypothetical protein
MNNDNHVLVVWILNCHRLSRNDSFSFSVQESLADKPVLPDKKSATARVKQQSFGLENDFTCDDVVDV